MVLCQPSRQSRWCLEKEKSKTNPNKTSPNKNMHLSQALSSGWNVFVVWFQELASAKERLPHLKGLPGKPRADTPVTLHGPGCCSDISPRLVSGLPADSGRSCVVEAGPRDALVNCLLTAVSWASPISPVRYRRYLYGCCNFLICWREHWSSVSV